MRLFLLLIITIAARGALTPPANTGSSYFIANEGQWEGDFQFKCEVGTTIYYITPQGMTIDFRQVTNDVGAAGVPPARDRFTNEQHSVILNESRDPSVTRAHVRGHVIQIHYSGLPPFTSAEMGGLRGASDSPLLAEGQGGASAFGTNKLPHYSNYFLSRDSTKWRSRVGHFENVVVPEVWPGIDVEYRADKQGVETIFHVQPGADPAQIQMEYLGLEQPLQFDANGNLILKTSLGELKEQAPYSYQQQGRVQQKITSSVRLLVDNRIGFELGEFDREKELVIDPLLYGTYLGGGAENACYIVVPGPDGGVYVAGGTEALSGFPTTPGAYDETGLFVGSREFCSRFGPDGEFIASTLFGEIQTSNNRYTEGGVGDMVYDSLRNCLWMSGAGMTGWPVTEDALDTLGDSLYDALILSFSSDLTELQYCSYFGGSHRDVGLQIAIDDSGVIYIVGGTYSTDFPVTPDAFFSVRRDYDGILWIYNPTSNSVEFSSYFGGSSGDCWNRMLVQLASDSELWLGGHTISTDIPVTENAFQSTLADTAEELNDVFVALISLSPPTIEYCTYLGGGGWDDPYSLSLSDSVLFIAGYTMSQDFPVSADALDTIGWQTFVDRECFVASLNWHTGAYRGTYLGGSSGDMIVKNSFQIGATSITLLGETGSEDFPITPDAYQSERRNGFVVKLNRDLSEVLYGTFVGGSGYEEFNAAYVENDDSLWIVGETHSFDLPVTPNAVQSNRHGLYSGFLQHFAIDTTVNPCDFIRVPELIATIEGFDVQLVWQPAEIPESCSITPPLTYNIYLSTNGADFMNIGSSTSTAFTDLDALHRYTRGSYHVTLRTE